jgi:hypothetical protein
MFNNFCTKTYLPLKVQNFKNIVKQLYASEDKYLYNILVLRIAQKGSNM